MDLLGPMRTFVRVVEAGSFTAVAAEQSTTQPTISRQVAALEEHLGARLLTRTTRALALTDDGRAFYEHALRALEAVGEAENAVGRRQAKPTGMLRLAVPVVLGRRHIVPRMARFLARYPEVAIDLAMSDGFIDMVEQGIDLAIRVGEITDQSLVARKIGMVRRLTVASPAYLKANGTPRTPDDLKQHDCIVYTRLATGNRWHFESSHGPLSVTVAGRYRVDNSEAVREGVLSGLGIAVIPAFAFSDEITRGTVKVLLKAYEPKLLPLNAVYPSRRYVPLRVRAMIDFLAHELEIDPVLSGS
ncbi:MAG: LysR family transcriptional regulator [Hyphomicrobiaceae bacterium]|nr:LysR family transcriptional regulator [Hyphomicrobiaceae bacterium]